ncbi:MAG: hypothetical protein ABSE06_01980, partial [Anaerolineaceae bacterium]
AAIIKETAHPDVNLIFGAVLDPNMGDEIRVTVIATGFDRPSSIHTTQQAPVVNERRNKSEDTHTAQRPSQPVDRSEHVLSPQPVPVSFGTRLIDTEDLDVPPFLRNHLMKQQSTKNQG